MFFDTMQTLTGCLSSASAILFTPYNYKSVNRVRNSHPFAIHRVDLLHHSRVELYGVCDVGKDLFIGMGCFLVQKNPHCFPGLHSAPHHRHKLRTDEVLAFATLWGGGLGAAQRRKPAGRCCCSLDVHWPVGVHVLCVIQLFVGFGRTANIAFTCWDGGLEKREGIKDGLFRKQPNKRDNL